MSAACCVYKVLIINAFTLHSFTLRGTFGGTITVILFFVIVIAPLPPYRWQHLSILGQVLAVRHLFGTAALGSIGVLHSPRRGSFGRVVFRLRLDAEVGDVFRCGVVVTYTLRAPLVLEGIVTYALRTLSLGLV